KRSPRSRLARRKQSARSHARTEARSRPDCDGPWRRQWENPIRGYGGLTASAILVGVVVVLACAGAGALYLHGDAAPGCDGEPVLRKVTDILREQFLLDGV